MSTTAQAHAHRHRHPHTHTHRHPSPTTNGGRAATPATLQRAALWARVEGQTDMSGSRIEFCVDGESTTMPSLQKAAMLIARGSVLGLMSGSSLSSSQKLSGLMLSAVLTMVRTAYVMAHARPKRLKGARKLTLSNELRPSTGTVVMAIQATWHRPAPGKNLMRLSLMYVMYAMLLP